MQLPSKCSKSLAWYPKRRRLHGGLLVKGGTWMFFYMKNSQHWSCICITGVHMFNTFHIVVVQRWIVQSVPSYPVALLYFYLFVLSCVINELGQSPFENPLSIHSSNEGGILPWVSLEHYFSPNKRDFEGCYNTTVGRSRALS